MKEFKTISHAAIGDILNLYFYVKSHYDEYDKFEIYIDDSIVDVHRESSIKVKNFVREITSLIYENLNKVVIKEIEEGVEVPYFMEVFTNHLVKDTKLRYFKLDNLLVDKNIIDEPYITIFTKVRGEDYKIYSDNKEEFYTTLNKISENYKIVIIGERNINDNLEYKILPNFDNSLIKKYSTHQSNIKNPTFKDVGCFIIYEDLLHYIDNKNIIDLTKEEILHSPDISNFLYDCSILNNAKASIELGASGNLYINIAFSNKYIGYTNFYNETLNAQSSNFLSQEMNNNDMFLTRDINKFIRKIGEYVKVIYCIGDSHTSIFNDIPNVKTNYIFGATASHFKNKKSVVYDFIGDINKRNDFILFVAGEIDCRVFLDTQINYYLSLNLFDSISSSKPKMIIEKLVDKYFFSIRNEYFGYKIAFYGPVASYREDLVSYHDALKNVFGVSLNDAIKKDHPAPEFFMPGNFNCKQRNEITKIFNDRLKILCDKYNIPFFTMFYDMIDEDMLTIYEMTDGIIHLNEKIKPLIMKKLRYVI